MPTAFTPSLSAPARAHLQTLPQTEALEQATAWVEGLFGLGPETARKALLSVVVVLAVWLVRRVVARVATTRLDDPRARYGWMKGTAWVAYLVVFLLLGQIWVESVRNVGTFLGLLTAGLAIALRDLITNMAGWVFILMRHPFAVGDRIQIGDHKGDVVDIRLFQFTLLEVGNWVHADQSTGRIIHVPNADVFSQPVANYTDEFPFVWHEMPVMLTFESDWRRARDLLQGVLDSIARDIALEAATALRRGSRKFLISYRHFSPRVYVSVEDSGVCLTLRFLAPVRQRRGLNERIWEAILDAFAADDGIDLAYPTRRLFINSIEGKPEARAPWPGAGRGGDAPVSPPDTVSE